jgi:uncharacterized protein (UPF0276 family)
MKPGRFVAENSSPQLPELGVGITYSSAIEPVLEKHADLVDVVEFEPQTTWVETRDCEHPYRVSDAVLDHIAQLPGRKLVHSIGAPVGGTVRPQAAQLALLRRMITKFDAPWASEHLSFNRTQEFSTGFFLPPRQTPKGVQTVTTSIRDLQEALPVPIAVETGVNYLRPRSDEMSDGAFVGAVADSADCGILLDLHNVFANAVNGRQPVEDFLTQLPLDRVCEIHLAGGFEMEGFWLDAHSGAIPDPLLEIARRVVPVLQNLKAIIFEIFPSFVPGFGLDGIRAEIEKLHALWELRGRARGDTLQLKRQRRIDSAADDHTSPAAWENALGALVIGRAPADEASHQLAADPGIAVVNRLAREFRASMIVSVLRLTSRLLMLALGPDIFRSILEDFWSKTPPQLFASSEAEAFATYLEALDVRMPHLAKVLQFERAVLATLLDDKPRVIAFEFDPLPLFRGLAEGRLTEETGRLGRFEIEVTGSGLLNAPGLGMESIQQVVPYH